MILIDPFVQFPTTSASLFLDGFFPIGVDLQPSDSTTLNKWNTRGINTFWRSSPLNGDPTTWHAAMLADGRFKVIRNPKPNMANDVNDPILLAWTHRDEADLNSNQISYQTIQTNYAAMKAAYPSLPVVVSTTGTMNQNDIRYYPSADPADGQPSSGSPWYQKYLLGGDWWMADRYPVNGGVPMVRLTEMLDRQVSYQNTTPIKPYFCYLECSDYNTSDGNPAPTLAEWQGEVWAAICKGVRGIAYFPERTVPTFSSDQTVAAIATDMPIQHARIQQIATALQGPIDPAGLTCVTSQSTLLKCWRQTATDHYYIVSNYSTTAYTNVTVTISAVGGATSATVMSESRNETITAGVLTDDFAAYQTHVYKVTV